MPTLPSDQTFGVGTGVGVGLGVRVGVSVGVGIRVGLGVSVSIGVYIAVGVTMGVSVSVGVDEGVVVGSLLSPQAASIGSINAKTVNKSISLYKKLISLRIHKPPLIGIRRVNYHAYIKVPTADQYPCVVPQEMQVDRIHPKTQRTGRRT